MPSYNLAGPLPSSLSAMTALQTLCAPLVQPVLVLSILSTTDQSVILSTTDQLVKLDQFLISKVPLCSEHSKPLQRMLWVGRLFGCPA
jgi:hypothetical protein